MSKGTALRHRDIFGDPVIVGKDYLHLWLSGSTICSIKGTAKGETPQRVVMEFNGWQGTPYLSRVIAPRLVPVPEEKS